MAETVEVRIHCRGGQGGVTAARIIGLAAIKRRMKAIAFPSFTVERRGAPVSAFIRILEGELLDRSFIYHPDYVLVLDCGLSSHPIIREGSKDTTFFLVNARSMEDVPSLKGKRLATVDALKIAMEVLKVPIVNTAMCGAFAAVYKTIDIDAVKLAIEETLPTELAKQNVEAALRAYEEVKVWLS